MTSFQSNGLKRFLLLYGSQTGQAKAIAEEIADAAPSYGLKADIYCLSRTDKRFCIENESCVVFIVSTTGDGEPPDTAVKFYRRISKHTLKNNFLKNLNYTVLALGDSNYIKFCLFGRLLERRLKALSAKSFYDVGYGDDAFGIETGVDPWIHNLWPALQKQLGIEQELQNCVQSDFLVANKNLNMFSVESLSDEEIQAFTIKELPSLLKDCEMEKLAIPKLPSPILKMTFDEIEKRIHFLPIESTLISRASDLVKVQLIAANKLTVGENVKDTLELTFQFEERSIPYVPGDSFGFICSNPPDEVEMLLERLQVLHHAKSPINVNVADSSINKRKIPAYIPPYLSLKEVFLHCIEIRAVPKKILLRILAEYTTDVNEKHALLFLSSQAGAKFYASCIRKPSLCVLDILMQYKSCIPPIIKLLEYLPCLKPRFYSVASSPLQDNSCFKVVFNVLKFYKGEGRYKDRKGICTGWLERLSSKLQGSTEKDASSLENKLSALTLNCDKLDLFVYKRTNTYFHLPDDLKIPIIMVGPGTGVAPFIGFLQHREMLMKLDGDVNNFGETWLFSGCRFEEKDFLFKRELHRLKSIGVLAHLKVSLSREASLPPSVSSRYVHESIKQNADAIAAAIYAGGNIYVCGDAKHMSHDVQQAFIDVFQASSGLTERDAKSFVEKLQTEHRYVNDVWA